MKLLICIAFHYDMSRLSYLKKILDTFTQTYDKHFDCKIVIDSNNSFTSDFINTYFEQFKEYIQVCIHTNLSHPFHLTWMHRKYMADNIDNYDLFMYIEDDIDVPVENFKNFLHNYDILWPTYIPGFIRVEYRNNYEINTDNDRTTYISHSDIIDVGNKFFVSLQNQYHGFWILKQKDLKDNINNRFVHVSEKREDASSFPHRQLGKRTLLEVDIDTSSIKTICHCIHLPNNYAYSPYHNGLKSLDKLIEFV